MNIRLLAIWIIAAASSVQAADTDLPLRVQGALDARNVPHESLSVYVSDVDTGEVVLKWLDGEPRNPASTIKLLTTLVARDV